MVDFADLTGTDFLNSLMAMASTGTFILAG